ncbi:MAG: hypothetical protein IPG69_00005 [Flavobacteriales bacterium]|nr:hypothetical protein [Flavobacteriales bacterium]
MIWYAGDSSCVIAGQASDGFQGFAIALRVSLSTGAIIWERSFTTSAFVSDCFPSTAPGAIALVSPATGLNANGSYPVNMNLIAVATGLDFSGGACVPLEPFVATTSWESLSMQDHIVTVLSPPTTIRNAIPINTRTLLVDACTSIPLPVELTHFEGNVLGTTIVLDWSTASENNNERYEIERSDDGSAWHWMAALSGQGSSFSEHRYQWVDQEPIIGINYYRLRQVDDNGSIELSHAVAVEYAPSQWSRLLIGQNPVVSGQVIYVRELATLHDVMGRKLLGPAMRFTAPSTPGTYLLHAIDRVEVFCVQ